MAIPTLYKWDDAGAPQLTRQAQSLLTILRKCLVDGYGSKAGLGWSISFDDAPSLRTVYRNASGKGELRVGPLTTATGDHVAFLAAGSFADIATAISPGLGDMFMTRGTDDFTRWAIAGTADAFFLTVWSSALTANNSFSFTRCATYFAGNMVSPIADDPMPFVATGRRQPSADNSTPASGYADFSLLGSVLGSQATPDTYPLPHRTYISGGLDGAASRRGVSALFLMPTAQAAAASNLYPISAPLISVASGIVLAEPGTAGTPPADKVGRPLIRGVIPGIKLLGVTVDAVNGQVVTAGPENLLCIQNTFSSGVSIMISLADWPE